MQKIYKFLHLHVFVMTPMGMHLRSRFHVYFLFAHLFYQILTKFFVLILNLVFRKSLLYYGSLDYKDLSNYRTALAHVLDKFAHLVIETLLFYPDLVIFFRLTAI